MAQFTSARAGEFISAALVRLMKLFKSGFVTIQEAQDQFFVVLNVHAFSGVR
jgi:hypothetical protein